MTCCLLIAAVKADDEVDVDGTVEEDLGKSRDGSRTDDEVVQRWVQLTRSTRPNLLMQQHLSGRSLIL